VRSGHVKQRAHDDERHGKTSLFAARDLKIGKVIGACHRRLRISPSDRWLLIGCDHCTRAISAEGDGER
jgi:hypothetical protein